MADRPQQGTTPPSDKKPVVVYHPRNSPSELALALKVGNLNEKIMVLVAGMAFILILTIGFALIEPAPALTVFVTAVVGFVVMVILSYTFVHRPVMMRAKLIRRGRAVWLPPGATREFYDAQGARIEQYVPPRHRMAANSTLFLQVLVMVREDGTMADLRSRGVATDDWNYKTSQELWDQARQTALYVISTYAEGEPNAGLAV